MLNTVFLTSERIGGGWTFTAELVHHLTQRKGDDEFIVLVNDAVADAMPVHAASGQRVVVPLAAASKMRRISWEQTSIPGLIRKYKPDLFHGLGNTLPVYVNCPAILTIADLQVFHYPENFPLARRLYLRTLIPWSVRRSERVIAISEFTRQDVIEQFGTDPRKVVAVPLSGMTTADDALMQGGADPVAKYGLPGRFLLSVGSSLPHKNLVRLIYAFAKAAPSVSDDLVILGESFANRGEIEAALRSTGLLASGRVRLLPFLPRQELLALYRAARGFVFPSLFEGFGIPVLEAMSCGCPVVAADATALPEVGGDAALYFDPLSLESTAGAITRICTDDGLRTGLIKRGQERARQFSWAQVAGETVKIYKDVLNELQGRNLARNGR
jgi:alpha-1,3-rhamnosyl/mannosyltransferase